MPYPEFFEYLQLEKQYSANTIKAYRRDLRSFNDFVLEEYGGQDLALINYSQIRSWIVQLVAQGISNRSINRKISSLKTFYKFLQKIKKIEVSPLAKHRALKVAKKVQVPFSEKEVMSALEGIQGKDFSSLRDQLMIEMFYSTGIRRMELIEIKMQDIDLSRGMLKVLGKRNKERYIPLLPMVVTTAKAYLEEREKVAGASQEPHLFLSDKGKMLYESFVYRRINDYFGKVSGKIKKSPHILRHSFATHLLNQGANLNAVKELLGHASLAATQVYTHNSIAELSKVHRLAHPRNKE